MSTNQEIENQAAAIVDIAAMAERAVTVDDVLLILREIAGAALRANDEDRRLRRIKQRLGHNQTAMRADVKDYRREIERAVGYVL